MRIIAALVVTLLASPSFADDGAHELEAALKPVAPSTGLDKAPLRAPPWCSAVRSHDDQWAYALKDKLDNFHPRTSSSKTLFEGVALVCSGATSPLGQRAAQVIEQLWINETGLSEADAVVSLTAHANSEQFEAELEKLCDKLPEDESDNQQRVFSTSRRALFGCEGEPLWSNRRNLDELHAWVDRGEVEHDGQLRLAWMLHRLYIDLDPTEKITDTLAGYAVDQFDLRLPNDMVMHTLDVEPFRGNRAARIILMESLANERMNAARLEAAVAAKPEWKDILVTAPRKAFDAWNAAAEKRKDVLARSDEAAKKGRGKDSHGDCEAPLRADLGPILKAMKHDSVSTLLEQISDDPLAGLLLARVAKCAKHDEAGEWVQNMSYAVRMVSGPRSAAWWAVVDAISAKKERFRTRALTDVGVDDERRQPYETELGAQGVVASATKSGKGLKVTFVHQRAVVDNWKCVEGTKVDRIDPDSGKVTYRQVCHADGKITVDSAPNPTVVPMLWAAGIAPGRLMRFRANDHGSMPAEVWADKSQKKLVAIYGFPLE